LTSVTALTSARQDNTRFTCPKGRDGRVDLGACVYAKMVYLSEFDSDLTGSEAQQSTDYEVRHRIITLPRRLLDSFSRISPVYIAGCGLETLFDGIETKTKKTLLLNIVM